MKPRILFIISSLKLGGGAERVTSSLTRKLAPFYDIHIITFFHFKNIYDFSGNYHTLNEKIQKKFIFDKLKLIFRYFKIKSLIRTISPRIIISVGDAVNISLIIIKALSHLKIPLIASIHTNPKMAYRRNDWYFSFLIKLLYNMNYINKIVTISKDLQEILVNNYNIHQKKLITIYNGVELEEINTMSKEEIVNYEQLFNDRYLKYITIGRFNEVKGHIYLFQAFSIVKREIENSKLILIGDGPLKNRYLTYIKRLNLENDIVLLGVHRNPFKFLINSDVFVLSSIYEGLPTVLLEALACRLPIISTNCITGPREILDNGKYGLLVPIKDPFKLAESMLKLAMDKNLLIEYSNKASYRMKTFDIKISIIKWRKIIEKSIIEKN